MYNWVTLLYNRDWHKIANQLSFNKKNNDVKNNKAWQIGKFNKLNLKQIKQTKTSLGSRAINTKM